MSQKQITIEEEKEEQNQQDDDLNMEHFLKDLKVLHKRMDQSNEQVLQQDKRLVNVNEKLENYNKEISHGEDLTDIVNKGVFSSLFDGIKGLFRSNESKKLNEEDKKILEKAKEKENIDNYDIKEDGDWEIIKKKNNTNNKNDKYDEDDIIDESINEVKNMIKSAKNFNKNIEDSKEVVKVTIKHFDKSLNHVNKAIKKMEDE